LPKLSQYSTEAVKTAIALAAEKVAAGLVLPKDGGGFQLHLGGVKCDGCSCRTCDVHEECVIQGARNAPFSIVTNAPCLRL
jgi:hypothetical protein